MQQHQVIRPGWFLALWLLLVAFAGGACNDSSPTNPYGGGGGGGGGGGTTFNLGPFVFGESIQRTFANVETIGYHCIPHRSMGMVGTVQVDATGADSIVVQVGAGNGRVFAPSTAHIKPGGYVRWVGASTTESNHTVTSN